MTAKSNSRAVLPPLLAKFFRKGERLASARTAAKTLHRFRLRVKRLRYTLELFRPCYGPTLDRHVASLRALQKILGGLNDCATARRVLRRNHRPPGGALREVLNKLDRREARHQARFQALWKDRFAEPAEQQRWLRYLSR